ncbi:MAG: hypothetical protein CBARDMAM_6107 [uncultured Caballeronia sp.]|nr:MAG: hypothetical protein CBARDMAM_6107 [uncultured Caballeronia sp.]
MPVIAIPSPFVDEEGQESRVLSLMDAVEFLLKEAQAPDLAHRREAQRRLYRGLTKQGRGPGTRAAAGGETAIAP